MKRVSQMALMLCLLAAVPLVAALSTSVRIVINHELTTTAGLSTPEDIFRYSIAKRLSSGTESAKCDQILSISRTIAAGSYDDIDLVGSETNPLNATVNMTRVRMLYLENTATGTITVGNGPSAFEGWVSASGTVELQASGTMLLIAPTTGWIATDTVSDILRLSSTDGSAFKLWAVGADE